MGVSNTMQYKIYLYFFIITLSSTFVNSQTVAYDLLNAFNNISQSDLEAQSLALLPTLDEDIFLNITQLLAKYTDYTPEVHIVQTTDGYLLKMIRLNCGGDPVVVFHGTNICADDWVTRGSGHALAYVLCDAGYDVWLGNARGTKHSKAHVSRSVYSSAFWDFSLHEIGYYDNAAMIDYALKETQVQQVKVISFSHGTTTSFILLSERPDYNAKVSILIALSPLAWQHNSYSGTQTTSYSVAGLKVVRALGVQSLGTNTEQLHLVTTVFCGTPELAYTNCYPILTSSYGRNEEQFDMASFPVVMNHFPSGVSMKQAIHSTQLLSVDRFGNYDYGFLGNILKYGSGNPPDYPVERITTKVAPFVAVNDWLYNATDLKKLTDKLTNDMEPYVVPLPAFCHTDFVYAKDVKTLINDKIIEVLNAN